MGRKKTFVMGIEASLYPISIKRQSQKRPSIVSAASKKD
jgi:hypothetical protein